MNELGFTESYLKSYFSGEMWKRFQGWIYGQTTAQVNGEETYLYYDVRRFCMLNQVIYPF